MYQINNTSNSASHYCVIDKTLLNQCGQTVARALKVRSLMGVNHEKYETAV